MEGDQAIITAVKKDDWMMSILEAVKTMDLPDWWICAGFVRSKIWDGLHGYETRTPLADIDVIYFDDENLSEGDEKRYEEGLAEIMPDVPWSVKNQARMHKRNRLAPYCSSVDAISKFPETATAIGIKLNAEHDLVIAAPCGTVDLMNLQIKPTPHFVQHAELLPIYKQRIEDKGWLQTWPQLCISGLAERNHE